MPFTAEELSNIANSTLDYFMGKGELYTQNVQSKPMLAAFDAAAGTFPGGKEDVSLGVKSGQGGLTLSGYTHDDQVSYGNPTPAKRVNVPWKEHHIGMGLTHTELKKDGITVIENGAKQTTTNKDGREQFALANLLEEKVEVMNEDYAVSMDNLIHGDGTSDTKAIAGIQSIILANPALGSYGGLNRTTNTWWRNRASTAAANAAGTGNNAITSATAGGGALLSHLQSEYRQYNRYARGGVRMKCFAGSDYLDAMETELRANGSYTDRGWRDAGSVNAGMATDAGVPFKNWTFVYDPTLDDLGLAKRAYLIDMKRIKLLYMQGEKMKKANPARPYDRYVMYRGVTTTAVMIAQQLNTSGVIDIA